MTIQQKLKDIILQQNPDAHLEKDSDYALTFSQIAAISP